MCHLNLSKRLQNAMRMETNLGDFDFTKHQTTEPSSRIFWETLCTEICKLHPPSRATCLHATGGWMPTRLRMRLGVRAPSRPRSDSISFSLRSHFGIISANFDFNCKPFKSRCQITSDSPRKQLRLNVQPTSASLPTLITLRLRVPIEHTSRYARFLTISLKFTSMSHRARFG